MYCLSKHYSESANPYLNTKSIKIFYFSISVPSFKTQMQIIHFHSFISHQFHPNLHFSKLFDTFSSVLLSIQTTKPFSF